VNDEPIPLSIHETVEKLEKTLRRCWSREKLLSISGWSAALLSNLLRSDELHGFREMVAVMAKLRAE
jgi:hypothetical protein